MPASVYVVLSAGDFRICVVARQIAGRQLRGAINPVARRIDEGSESADFSEHLHKAKTSGLDQILSEFIFMFDSLTMLRYMQGRASLPIRIWTCLVGDVGQLFFLFGPGRQNVGKVVWGYSGTRWNSSFHGEFLHLSK